jgi:hypothetical protein
MCHATVFLGILLQSLAILSVPNSKPLSLVFSLILSQIETLMRQKSLQPSEITSALDIFGFSTWEIVGITQATASVPAGATFNTITSKPIIPAVTTGTFPTGSQSAGSDKIVFSSFFLIISLLAILFLS